MNLNRQKILFVVGTEYHMLVTLSAIADLYSDTSKFEITIIQLDSAKKNRFRQDVNLELSNVIYKALNTSCYDKSIENHFKAELNRIENYRYNTLIIFNEHVELCVYLAKSLSSKGTHVILAPDGMKSYDNLTQIAPRWSFKFALRYMNFVRNNQLNSKFNKVWPRMRYAFLKEVTELWITNPDVFNNWNNKKVTQFNVMQSPEAVNLINRFFAFDPREELKAVENVIFLICMPPKFDIIEKFNQRLIENLSDRFPDRTLVLKLHPSTNEEQIKVLQKYQRCILIQSHKPAELFIAQLHNSIVISYWSTSSLINNVNCRFYWLHKALANEIVMPGILKIKNPTKHIIEVESISEIQ